MNHWARFLSELPATHQRLIARAQRVSLPRGSDATVRVARLRFSLCHQATVHAVFATLEPPVRAALADLRVLRRGMRADELVARYGPIRPLRQLAADPHPQSVSERLLLLGWLFERRDARGRAPRWLLPPELRRWLPRPPALADLGAAPAPARPPILRAAATIVLASAEHPLAVRADGRLRRTAMRMLAERLAPSSPADAAALLEFTLPLLATLGLLACHAGRCEPTPAARRFLAQPDADQLARLAGAWVALPTPDAWLARLLRDDRAIDLPLLRRRLIAWASTLPAGRLIDPQPLVPALTATLGPLADALTHGWRTVDRTPWRARRAATIFQAALSGPLAWLGVVGWALVGTHAAVFRPATPPAAPEAGPWRYLAAGQLAVPHGAASAAVPGLLPYASWHSAGATHTVYQISPTSLARAAGRGYSTVALRALLVAQAGPIPAEWAALLEAPAALRIVRADVLIADQPAALTRAARSATVQRALAARLAPGIALVAPGRTRRLVRALAQLGLAAEHTPRAEPATPPNQLTPGQCAALLEICATHRHGAPPDVLPLGLDRIEECLRAGLSPALRDAAEPPPPVDLPPFMPAEGTPGRAPLAETLAALRAAIKVRKPIEIAYDTGAHGAPAWRSVRPVLLERHFDIWMLHAYCAARRSTRTFRVDRIAAIRRP